MYDTQSGPGEDSGEGLTGSCAPVTLLHPFTPKGKLIWRGEEGFRASLDIMEDTGYNNRVDRTDLRIIRPFYDEARFTAFKLQLERTSLSDDVR